MTNIPPPPPPEYYYQDAPIRRPEAQEKGSSAAKPAADVKVRKDFSETFCWTDVITKS